MDDTDSLTAEQAKAEAARQLIAALNAREQAQASEQRELLARALQAKYGTPTEETDR